VPDTPTQLKVFVSHSSQDKAVCDAVVTALRSARADVWCDEHNLGAGQLWEEIQRELKAWSVFVVLLSKNAFASQWVRRKTTWAFNLASREPNRLILPITVGAIEPSGFDTWLFLEGYKRVEARGMQPHPHDEVIAQTLRMLALTPRGQAPVAVTPQAAENLDDLLIQGRALQAQKKHVEALPFFQQATQLDPSSFSAWTNLGHTLTELGRYTEALPASERAIALDPNHAIAWNNTGVVLEALKRCGEALAAYEQEATLAPDDARGWWGTGAMVVRLQRYQEAVVANDRALAVDPSSANAWNNKGWALTSLGRHEEAIQAYDSALAIVETSTRWKNKAVSLRALGREAEAPEAEHLAKELGA
jgi:tetratricopeptide (TPR) repeat protein